MTADHDADRGGVGLDALLRARRHAIGLTQAELAARAGVGIRTLRDLERGHASRPQRTTVELLARALGLTGAERAGFHAAARGQHAALPAAHTFALPPAGPLVGRDKDAADLAAEVIEPDGAVNLVGLAGVGKSCLALTVAHQVADQFPGGVAGVLVTDGCTRSDLLSTIAAGFHLPRADDLVTWFPVGPGLLLLDAVERSPAAVVAAARWLSVHAPSLRILATGRHPLGLPGERVRPVSTLEVPPPDPGADVETVAAYPAAALFLARLRRVRQEPLAPDEVGALVSIVRRLGGLPLALELAAARGRVLDLNEILHRYGDNVLDLAGSPWAPANMTGTEPARAAAIELATMAAQPGLSGQPWAAAESDAGDVVSAATSGVVTLRDAVADSYRLLDSVERRALRRLAVFRNRWSVDLAEALLTDEDAPDGGPLAGDPVPLLDRLLSLGMLSVRGSGPVRFRLLDVVRDFAIEQAVRTGELAVARRHHARVFTALAARVAPELAAQRLPTTVARLDEVTGDLWAALGYAADDDPPTALCLAANLVPWWLFRGREVPGRQWLRRLLADPRTAGAPIRVRAWAQIGVAALAIENGAGTRELPAAEAALAAFQRHGDVAGELAAHNTLAVLFGAVGDEERADRHRAAGLELERLVPPSSPHISLA